MTTQPLSALTMLLSRHTRRREFITLLGGAAATAWPLTARAQQAERMRRIGVLMAFAANDPEARLRVAAFEDELRDLGWIDGRNIRIDYRWAPDDPELLHSEAAALTAAVPDVILV